jgi:hypothetical protein
MDWFRSWHGAPTDPKWLLIAKRSETQAGIVSAIVWALFDFASQNSADRGSVEAFDAETYAAFSGFDESAIQRVIECLKEKKLIIDGHLAAWEKRQTKREDNSTPRVQAHRNAKKRNVTPETPREEKIREEKIDSEAKASGADAPPDPAIPERDYFIRGREVLGKGAGAMIANLLKAKGRNVSLARAALEQASQKSDPLEYVAAICRGPPVSSKPLTEFQIKQRKTNDVTDKLKSSALAARSGGTADWLLPNDHGERSGDLRGGTGPHVLALSGPSGGRGN